MVAEARNEDPAIFVQDYRFALLPAMVLAKLLNASIITFLLIPWLNPESFGICPWRKEIVEGPLGGSIQGFHTPYHRKNIIDTGGELSDLHRWPAAEVIAQWTTVAACRDEVFAGHGLAEGHPLAVGVDRFGYTKGIIQRLNAVARC